MLPGELPGLDLIIMPDKLPEAVFVRLHRGQVGGYQARGQVQAHKFLRVCQRKQGDLVRRVSFREARIIRTGQYVVTNLVENHAAPGIARRLVAPLRQPLPQQHQGFHQPFAATFQHHPVNACLQAFLPAQIQVKQAFRGSW